MSKTVNELRTWDAIEKELFTPEEMAESHARAAILCELIDARNEGKITQKQLEEMSGVKQSMISRIEKGVASPTIDTLLKLLTPLGKTIAIVPIESKMRKA